MAEPEREEDSGGQRKLLRRRGPQLSRRQLLKLGGTGVASAVALGAAGAVGYEWREIGSSSASTVPSNPVSPQAHYYRSRPDLVPPKLQTTVTGATPDYGYFLTTPNHGHVPSGPGQVGVMMTDASGEVVWFLPTAQVATNLQVQTYQGKPVLTWWQGTVTASGHGEGLGLIYDTAYHHVATIRAGNGLREDLHELTLTAQNTALITAYQEVKADLTGVGGPANGSVFDGVVQEIDVATGKVLFEWRAMDHVPVTDTYDTPPTPPFDYFHINSIGVDPTDNNLLISSRNTWTLYKVDRKSGAILWRLGGKQSDFTLGPGVHFYWQHHARVMSDGTITVFDDGASPTEEPQSRGLHLAIDESTHRATLLRAFTHSARLLAENQGSVELLPDGGAVVGWGSEPYLTEFAPDGSILVDAVLPTNGQSYRAFRSAWTGAPEASPDVAYEGDDAGGYTFYSSWNGATEVVTWQAMSGNSPDALSPVGSVRKAGFETAMTVHPSGKYVAMAALDAAGKEIGRSKPVAV